MQCFLFQFPVSYHILKDIQ